MRLLPSVLVAALAVLAVSSIAGAQGGDNATPPGLPGGQPALDEGPPEEATGPGGLYMFVSVLVLSALAVLGLLVVAFVAWRSPR